MKVLFLNRVHPPAAGATGQLLSALAPALAGEGWQVTVLSARAAGAPSSETRAGVRLERAGLSLFTRGSHWRRALCYLSLYPAFLWRAVRLPRCDVIVTMTDPPLLLLLGPLLKWLRGGRLVHWAQDLYPELAEELGVLRKGGGFAGICRWLSTWALRRHDRVVVVGRCMQERLRRRGVAEEALRLIPNWAGTTALPAPAPAANPFRAAQGLEGRFVVMYSGNFGLAHAFEAMLEAAAALQARLPEVLFLLVGDGAREAWLKRQVEIRGLANVRFLPPQPSETLSQSLGGADLHLISMQAALCGLVVPSKLYGILAAGRASIFLGPEKSETAQVLAEHRCGTVLPEADGPALARCVEEWAADPDRLRAAGDRARSAAEAFTLARAAAAFRELLSQVTGVFFSAEERAPQQIPSRTRT